MGQDLKSESLPRRLPAEGVTHCAVLLGSAQAELLQVSDFSTIQNM